MLTFKELRFLLPLILQEKQSLIEQMMAAERNFDLAQPCRGEVSGQGRRITLSANEGFSNVFSLIVSELNALSENTGASTDELIIKVTKSSGNTEAQPEDFIEVINTIIRNFIKNVILNNEVHRRSSEEGSSSQPSASSSRSITEIKFNELHRILPNILQKHRRLIKQAMEGERYSDLTQPCYGEASDQERTIKLSANKGFENAFSLIVNEINTFSNNTGASTDELIIIVDESDENAEEQPEHFIEAINRIVRSELELPDADARVSSQFEEGSSSQSGASSSTGITVAQFKAAVKSHVAPATIIGACSSVVGDVNLFASTIAPEKALILLSSLGFGLVSSYSAFKNEELYRAVSQRHQQVRQLAQNIGIDNFISPKKSVQLRLMISHVVNAITVALQLWTIGSTISNQSMEWAGTEPGEIVSDDTINTYTIIDKVFYALAIMINFYIAIPLAIELEALNYMRDLLKECESIQKMVKLVGSDTPAERVDELKREIYLFTNKLVAKDAQEHLNFYQRELLLDWIEKINNCLEVDNNLLIGNQRSGIINHQSTDSSSDEGINDDDEEQMRPSSPRPGS